MRYFINTYGCQANISDSQRIAQKLESLAYKSAPEKEADLIIVNACAVRQKAVDRIWGKINQWQNQNKKIILTGCVLTDDLKKFKAKGLKYLPIKKLPNFIKKTKIKNYLHIKPKISGKTAFVQIMTGCDNYCTYCAVPYTRGREQSRPQKDILAEIKTALNKNCTDILLLGQNVNSYKLKTKNSKRKTASYDLKDNIDFIKLLITIDKLPENFQFNFLSSNPHDFSDKLIETLAQLKKWPRELHLPLQSGDDEILKKMNRRYSVKQYLEIITKLKSQIPNLKLATDIIVGFPGESQKQFQHTYNLCKKIKFDKAYLAQYSPRPGTTAAKLKDNVTPNEKKRRWLILENLINK